jgi:ribonuclease HI
VQGNPLNVGAPEFVANWVHYELATNSAMEIRAVVEALRVLPDGVHVWVSTDSAYVKKGVAEWLPNWERNH